MKRQCVLAIAALIFSFAQAHADTRERAITITTDAFPGTFAIDAVRDSSGAVTEMLYQTPDTSNGVLTLGELHQGPQVLYSKDGHDAILFSIENDFDPRKGGHADVRYLENGMSDTYKDFRVLIDIQDTLVLRSDPNPNDPDSDNNPYSGVFNQLFMKKNTVWGIVIGIKKVIPSYH